MRVFWRKEKNKKFRVRNPITKTSKRRNITSFGDFAPRSHSTPSQPSQHSHSLLRTGHGKDRNRTSAAPVDAVDRPWKIPHAPPARQAPDGLRESRHRFQQGMTLRAISHTSLAGQRPVNNSTLNHPREHPNPLSVSPRWETRGREAVWSGGRYSACVSVP